MVDPAIPTSTQPSQCSVFVLEPHLSPQQKTAKLMAEFHKAQQQRPAIYRRFEE
jgi:hypothetical protein